MGVTKPDAGVMATRPATAPEIAPRAVARPLRIHSAALQPIAAAAAPKWVAMKAEVARVPAFRAEPALNPNHPTHSKHAPIKLRTTECGGIGWRGYSSRLPRYNAVTSADTPEVMCTTVPPAKSRQGKRPPRDALRNPPLPQTICAIGLYTKIAHNTMNASMAENFIRSANAPVINAGVMMANINWNTINVCRGIVAAYLGSGASPTPRRNTLCKPPMNALPSPNASE